jgi:hypothetical protein
MKVLSAISGAAELVEIPNGDPNAAQASWPAAPSRKKA